MAIDAQRPEYAAEIDRWRLVDDMVKETNLENHIEDLDVLEGLGTIEGDDGTVKYYKTGEQTRNRDFKRRASFFGASRMTLESLIGVAFEKDPSISVPTQLEYLLKNVDGSGVDMWQQMQEATGEALKKARGGLYVTMPQTEGNASLADQEALRAVATINLIDASRIINWWTKTDGSETYLAGVVFTDTKEVIEDYEVEKVPTCRELALDDAGYFFDRTWTKDGEDWMPGDQVFVKDASGAYMNRIPFLFFGARRNHWGIQTPPMLSLARKNRDHYRNSAINEEGIWFSGHIQPVADEMDPEAFDTLADGFKIGGGHLMIAKGFRFEVAQPNSAARQGMLDKAEEMAALGAKMLKAGGVAKTAQQDSGEQRTQHSILSLVSLNVEDAYQWACEKAAQFMGADMGAIEVKLNRSFMDPAVTPEKMREVRENILSGITGPEEAYIALQRAGDMDPAKTLEDYQAELASRGVMIATDNADT